MIIKRNNNLCREINRDKIDWLLFVLLIPLFGSKMFAYFAVWLGDIPRCIAVVISFTMLILYKKISKIMFIIVLYSIFYAMNFIFHSSNNMAQGTFNMPDLYILLTQLSICAIIEVYVYAKKSPLMLFKTTQTLLLLYTLINFFIRSPFPYAVMRNEISGSEYYGLVYWLFGHRNNIYNLLFLTILFMSLYSLFKNNRFKFIIYLMLGFVFYNEIVAWSAASLVGMFVLTVFIVFWNKLRKVNIKHFLIISIIAYLGIPIFRIQNIFEPIIVGILHRNLTFTGRIFIWDEVLKIFSKSPFVGYGSVFFHFYGNGVISAGAWHCHNFLIGVLHNVGIVGVAFWVLMFACSSKQLLIKKSNNISLVIGITIFSYLVVGIATNIDDGAELLPLLVLGYHVPEIERQREEYVQNQILPKSKMHIN